MYKIAEFNDGKSEPNKKFSIEFQGKNIYPCTELNFWFRWGEYTFDIREIRRYFKRKEVKSIDFDFKMYPYVRFEKRISEIIKLVGNTPFENFAKIDLTLSKN